MGYQEDRDQFVAIMTREGMPLPNIRGMLRQSATLHRLAEASCNGDWPADNGERRVEACPQCGGSWVPSSYRRLPNGGAKVCPDCYAEARTRAITPAAFTPIFQGDPRGCVLKIAVPSHYTNDGNHEGVCVPVRS